MHWLSSKGLTEIYEKQKRVIRFKPRRGELSIHLLSSLFALFNYRREVSLERARRLMLTQQIKNRGIKEKVVLQAMGNVPRERFLPPSLVHSAYDDRPLPIGEGQTISQPYIVAFMTEALSLKGGEKVLEIGTGSGYQAAILAEIAAEVFTVEIIEGLSRRAQETLGQLGYSNIHFRIGDGYLGWPEQSAFDRVMVTCATLGVPPPLLEQLAEGGRMVIPVGAYFQTLRLLVKKGGKTKERDLIPVIFVPMTGPHQR